MILNGFKDLIKNCYVSNFSTYSNTLENQNKTKEEQSINRLATQSEMMKSEDGNTEQKIQQVSALIH